jgi:hypothetical protein
MDTVEGCVVHKDNFYFYFGVEKLSQKLDLYPTF